MENTETVGSLLRRERESRNLSLQDVQDATKITMQNLSALEEDRFDYFPNRVYTRAFLRDYANFLGLDSGALLSNYEGLSNVGSQPVALPSLERPRRSVWKAVLGVVITLAILAAAAAGAYLYWTGRGMRLSAVRTGGYARTSTSKSDGVATLPKAPAVPQPEPPKPTETPKPAVPVVPVKPDTMTVQVAALEPVWVRITGDDQRAYEGILPKGAVKSCQAKKIITVRAGKLGAVQVKWNGVKQAPLGSLSASGEKDFLFADAPAVSATPVPVPAPPAGSTAPAAPTTPATPPAPAHSPI